MSVRVIAGSAKGRRIAVPDVAGVRPTSDRARETLFNILAPDVAGARVLDAFAGSGAVGIEALSRGAAEAVFIERDRHAAGVIEANLELCRLAGSATVHAGDWRPILAGPAAGSAANVPAPAARRFDIVFLDPPYDSDQAPAFLEAVAAADLAARGGVAIVEHRGKNPPAEAASWTATRAVAVGETSFTFYRLRASSDGAPPAAGVGG